MPPEQQKSKLDYFIERTDKRLDGMDEKLDRIAKFVLIMSCLCVLFSSKGEKLFEMVPKLLDAATAVAGGR